MRRVRVIPHIDAYRQGGAVLTQGREGVVFGSLPQNRVRMVNPQGHSYRHISGQAGRIALWDGIVYVDNLSHTHGLVYRRWGYGGANDTEIPAARTGRAGRSALADGLWWIRNGQAREESGRLRHPRDEDVCWILVEVTSTDAPPAVPRGVSTGTGDLALVSPVPPVTVELTATQLITIAHIFREYLSLAPRVSPRPLTDATLKNLTARSFSQRRSEVRQTASAGGYPGAGIDEGMLAWFLSRRHLTYDALLREPEARDTLGLFSLR